MKLTCIGSLVLLAAAAQSVHGWWDNGHMLVSEIATQSLAPSDVTTLNALLSKYDRDFPNTGTVTTASIWGDLIKCSSVVSTYCPSVTTPALNMLDEWHYVNLPVNVNGTDYKNLTSSDGTKLIKEAQGGQALDFLTKTFTTFGKTQSAHAANWALRMLLHVFGDIANPMHNVAGMTSLFPDGDFGGNKFLFKKPCVGSNLHAIWDSVGAKYGSVNWSPTFVPGSADYAALQANATALLSKYGTVPDKLDFGSVKDVDYPKFVTAMNSEPLVKIQRTFLESYDVARQVAYKNIDLNCTLDDKQKCINPCPSSDYVNALIASAEASITVQGKRLSVILTQIAKQIRALNLLTPVTTPAPPPTNATAVPTTTRSNC
ncbi:hypothetical protein H257_15512 [Aphanomyces astaci]|uniref:Uncharacterized protein n=1 Tax=Aphanomyces astaci TaxID=112090 RepID=W4FNU7_APHAT|nr:hypothetical protein H257_15512 [Aphanomyces astaci]ETV68514.1 hypothetical protein H257_15512 [Aphanomyces astaci]RQM10756.1 hypothetical protein B5M09_010108 [Aphanomyces astaci]|eukprot:XP_009841943.1 hypothetical protein H257_15512 [Aphanomyces astaci]